MIYLVIFTCLLTNFALVFYYERELIRVSDEASRPTYQLRLQVAEQRRWLNAFWREETRRNRGFGKHASIKSKKVRSGKDETNTKGNRVHNQE